jgi:dihydropyrimidinase
VYGLAHRKGRIAVGLDADLALWDPQRNWQLDHTALHSRVDFTPYAGRTVTGKPVTVLVRGTPIIMDEVLQARPGFGSFVPRLAADPAESRPPVEDTTPWLDS